MYLQRARRTLFFPLWERRRNFQTPSSEEGTPLEMCSWSREAAKWAMSCQKHFCIKASCDWPSRPFINSLLLFQIANSCASYYPSSCGDSPPRSTTRGKKGKKQRPSLGLGVFYVCAQLAAHAWGAKVGLQFYVKQWRRFGGSVHSACASPFRYFQLGHANKREKKVRHLD